MLAGLDVIDKKLEDMEDNANGPVKQARDRIFKKAVEYVLNKAEKVTKEMLIPPYAPGPLNALIDGMHREIWPEIQQTLKGSLVEGPKRDFKEFELLHWASAPRFWPEPYKMPPRPWLYLRAKLLYALQPADANKFKHLGDPVALAILLFKLYPYFGCNVIVYIFLFVLIDKRDENQLVKFILSFKAFQFISGLISATRLCLSLWGCLELTAMHSVDRLGAEAALLPAINSGGPVAPLPAGGGCAPAPATCIEFAPGQGFDFPVVMGFEAVRIVLILAAGTLLAGGAASGGIEELYAIEEVRLDASDGHVDGSANRRALRFQSREKKGSAQRPLLADHDDGRAVSIATGLPLPARVRAATEAARIKFGAERRTGGKLPWFILYDLVVIIVVGTDLVAKLSRLRVQGAPTWLLWSSCYYAKLTWALLSFPFLMFNVPVMGGTLHRSKATAYDQAGKLVPQLSAAKIKRKVKIEEKEERLKSPLDDATRSEGRPAKRAQLAATKIQSTFRGSKARRTQARAMRHALALFTPVGLFVPASTIEKWFS